MNNKTKLKKICRFISIYGVGRTFYKIMGRIRINTIKLPSLKEKSIGLIGCGQFGFATIGYFISKKSKYGFLRAFDINEDNQKSFEKFHNIEYTNDALEIFNDEKIKVVYIASNHFSHTNYAIEGMKHNKSIYVEKPISVNYSQFKDLLESIKKYNANIFVGYNRPFSGAILDLKKEIKSNIDKPFSINYFISGHMIEQDHWYRNPEEGTRICGNVGHWLDLSVHILSWRKVPDKLEINISYSNLEEVDDNISITITTEYQDIISIMLTSRCEPFEGINETINLQYDNVIAKIDDFRKIDIWKDDKLIRKKYWPKDVGHKKAILQPFNVDKYKRDFNEVVQSTLLMLFITDMVLNQETNRSFSFQEEYKKLQIKE